MGPCSEREFAPCRLRAFDDGSKVYIEFPSGIGQGEMPPLFVIGGSGNSELVNYRARQNYYVVDRLTEHVFDSPTGSHLLIPQGSRLIGQYDSQVAFGQSRVLLVWSRLIMPDGTSIVLERLQGADPQGFSGLEDEVDYHWGQLFRAAALSTLLGIGTEIGSSNDENEIAKAIRESAQDTVSDVGQQIVRRQLNIQPTLTIRPGFPVRVIVQRDLLMQPYSAAKEEK
ncbi:TrbI/VirB10 family protein [Rhizobium rhizogenes]